MPLAQTILLNVPTFVLGFFIVGFAVVFSISGILLVRRFIDVKSLRSNHDIAGPIFSTLGVVYAVLLAFVVIISWQNYDRASNDVVREATCYASIYRDLNGFPEPFQSQAKKTMDEYVQSVIKDEWPLLARGENSARTNELALRFWKLYASFEPKGEVQIAFYREALGKMNEAVEMRRQRLVDSRTGIHPVLWFVLLSGGLITITFTFFFGSENLVAQLIMTNLLSVLIAMILLTTLSMDYPFTGDVSISPDAFQQVLVYLSG